jgi:hypothetical protein
MLRRKFLLFSSLLFQLVSANTEKLIFTAKKTDKPCTARSNVFHLSPPYSEVQNNLIPDTITTQLYLLDKLNVDESYELRISYPAIVNVDVDDSMHIVPNMFCL